MAKLQVRSQEQKRFVKLFGELCQWNSPGERWYDMINLFAIDIANTVDAVHREKRNELYVSIARKYKPEEFQKFAELFAEMVIQLEANPYQDFLGSMYMELDLGNDNAGQFFTPYHVAKMMAELTIDEKVEQHIRDHGYIIINDPTCGGGATLISAADRLNDMGINWQDSGFFIGQDLDRTVALMCYIQMSLIGCIGYVRIGDTLEHPQTCDPILGEGNANTWYFPMTFLNETWQNRILLRRIRTVAGSIETVTVRKAVLDG